MEYYKLLGVAVDASEKELRAAFRREAKRVHPDAHPHLAGKAQLAQQRRFILLAQAYETLRDPVRRRAYDARFTQPAGAGRARTGTAGGARPAGRSERARPRPAPPPGDEELGVEDLLRDLEGRLRSFGLDLRSPLEALLDKLLAWAREVFRQVQEPGEASPEGGEPPPKPGPGPGGEAHGARPAPGHRAPRKPPPQNVEGELADLKQQVRRDGRRSTARTNRDAVEAELRRIKARRGPPR